MGVLILPLFLFYGFYNKLPQIRWLKTTAVYSLSVLEASNTKSRYSSPDSVSNGPQEAFSLASSQLLVGARNLWHSLACRWITPSSASVGAYGSSCVSGSPPSLLLQNDPILANYVCEGPISQQGHILRFQVDMNFGGHYPTVYPFIAGY